MSSRVARLVSLALLSAAIPCQQPASGAGADVVVADAPAWQPHRATKVLYAGWPNGSREAAFRAFLERHFDATSVIDLAKLSPATAKGFDIVIADWCSQYGTDGYKKHEENPLHKAPVALDDDFDTPVIAMDYVGTNLRSQRKLDWL